MGLGVALAGTFMATEGLKDLYGKPRPDMLARCDPDISAINEYAVSGLGRRLAGAPTMVTWEICRNKGDDTLKVDGFASFPSGHSSSEFIYVQGDESGGMDLTWGLSSFVRGIDVSRSLAKC